MGEGAGEREEEEREGEEVRNPKIHGFGVAAGAGEALESVKALCCRDAVLSEVAFLLSGGESWSTEEGRE